MNPQAVMTLPAASVAAGVLCSLSIGEMGFPIDPTVGKANCLRSEA